VPELLTPELNELRDLVAALAADTLVRLRDDPSLSPTELRRRTRDASQAVGLYPMAQSGSSVLGLVVARDTLGQYNVGHLPGLFGAGPGVLAGVGEPLRSSHLLPVLAGEKQAGFAFTEPDSAPRPSWGRLEGDELVINGQKSYVTGGAEADFLTALVEVEDRGPAMVVIDTAAEGVTMTRRFGSIDGSHHAAFTFSEVRVPATHIVGAAGEGRTRALGKISEVRLSIAAGCVGVAAWIIEHVTDCLQAPRRGGVSLSARDNVRLRYGDMRIKAFAARSAVYRTARLADLGENVVNEAMACKVFATETVGELADAAVQLEGGEALVEGHPLEGVFRRVRTLRLAEGESDVLRLNVARGRLDLGLGRL
jgi:alkylation response protein AidB-like acyl-CoA dehydrogenase